MKSFTPLFPAAFALALLAGCSKPAPAPEPIRMVRTVTVASAQVGSNHEYAAEIRARTEVRLSFRVGGKLSARSVEVGQRVKAGELVARLDPEDLRLSQDAARAALAAAQANHDWTAADFKRFKELRDQGFISGAELDRREAALKSAQAQLDQARAQAAVQGNQAAYTSLVAPAAGVVVAVDAEPGVVLAAGAPVLRLALDGPRDVVFSVPEDAAAALRQSVGRSVRVSLWNSNGKPLDARIREVAAAADPATRTYLVKADVAAAGVDLGQTASVVVAAAQQTAQTLLPMSALREHQGKSTVWVVDLSAQKVQRREVAIGGTQGNQVVVVGGLKTGEQVVSAGVHVLTEGQAVKLAAAPSAATAATPVAR